MKWEDAKHLPHAAYNPKFLGVEQEFVTHNQEKLAETASDTADIPEFAAKNAKAATLIWLFKWMYLVNEHTGQLQRRDGHYETEVRDEKIVSKTTALQGVLMLVK